MRTLNFEGQAAVGSYNDYRLKYQAVSFVNSLSIYETMYVIIYIFIEAGQISVQQHQYRTLTQYVLTEISQGLNSLKHNHFQ